MSTEFQAFYARELSTLKSKYEQKLLQINTHHINIARFTPLIKSGARTCFSSPIKQRGRIKRLNVRAYLNDSQQPIYTTMKKTVTLRKLCHINLMGNNMNASIKSSLTESPMRLTERYLAKAETISPKRVNEFIE